MIKIVAKNGKYKQSVKGNILEIMQELANIIKHMMVPNPSRRDQVQEKSIAFAAMVGIAEYFNKSEMLELLHDACEDVISMHKGEE